MKKNAISWKTRDRNLVHKVCRYLGVRCGMNINRITMLTGLLTKDQKEALKPLYDNGSISILTFEM